MRRGESRQTSAGAQLDDPPSSNRLRPILEVSGEHARGRIDLVSLRCVGRVESEERRT